MILPLPETPSGIARVKLEIQRVDYGAPEASGRQGGVQAGFPVWGVRLELDRIDPVSADLWSAFIDRLRGRIRRFYCGDSARPRPVAHAYGMLSLARAGGGAFDGAATGWSQTVDADGDATITLSGLPAGFVLTPRDLIGFKWDADGAAAGTFERRTVARCVTSAVADEGGEVSIIAEPPLDTELVPAGAIAHFDNPLCVMQQVPEETDLAPVGEAGTMSSGTIVGIQDLRP
ncbi:hypothetical protein AAG598_07710 [Citromicrobium bathyomarinum]